MPAKNTAAMPTITWSMPPAWPAGWLRRCHRSAAVAVLDGDPGPVPEELPRGQSEHPPECRAEVRRGGEAGVGGRPGEIAAVRQHRRGGEHPRPQPVATHARP